MLPEDKSDQNNSKSTRRGLLIGGAAASGSLILPAPALAGINKRICVPDGVFTGGPNAAHNPTDDFEGAVPLPLDDTGERRVRIKNVHHGDVFDEVYAIDGAYVPEALEIYNYVSRDSQDKTSTNMDPKLLDIIYQLSKMLGFTGVWHMNSGYRSPAHNTKINGAKNSLHVRGRANDIVCPGRSPSSVYSAAHALSLGGVGKYQNFTHVDTGLNNRRWSG